MRALVALADTAGPQVLEIGMPEPGPGQVRIKVAAAAVNPKDVFTAAGGLVGVGLSDQLSAPVKTHAEHVVLDAAAVTTAPRDVEPVAASTLALNALTARQSLELLDLTEGQTLLVTGADVFVPRSPDLDAAVRSVLPGGVDAAIDPAALGIGTLGIGTLEAVRNRGRFATVVGGATPLPVRGITVHTVFVDANASQLAELVTLVESGNLSLRVADTYPLADATTAYEQVAKGGVRGRIVLVA